MAGPQHALTIRSKGPTLTTRRGSACRYYCTFL